MGKRPLSRVPGLLTALFTVAAWLCALLALVPLLRSHSGPVRVAAGYLAVPIRPNLAYAAFLGLLATSLRRRTRMSWWVVVLLYFGPAFVGSLLAGFAEPPLFLGAAILFVLLALTVLARRQFPARLEKGNGVRALATLVVGLAVASALGWLLVSAFPGSLAPGIARAAWAFDHVVGGLGTARTLNVVGRPPPLVTFLCGLFGAVAFLAGAWVLFRPTRGHATLSPGQETRIRALLAAAGGRDSLGYFATRRDKAAIFSDSGKAAVTYRVVFGTSLASGDPVGDPEAWPPAIAAWLAEARAYAWSPAVLGVSEQGAQAYQRAGLSALQIGDEAVIETAEFTLEGRAMRGVRQAVHRVRQAGHTCRIRRHADVPPREMAEVLDHADTWRDTRRERGFSMALGRLGDPADARCVLVEARDRAGDLRAVLSFVPWGERGLSLDLMRRDPAAGNGLVEFLVVGLVEASRHLGVERISLNFATFREVFEQGARIGAGPFVRVARSVLLFVSRWWQFESLYRSNAKYRPAWEPRLLCFAASRDLPRISVALGLAEGFIAVPALGRRRGLARGRDLPAAGRAAPLPPAAPASAPDRYADLPEQERVRRRKLDRLRAAGVDPYPVGFPRTTTTAELRAAHPDLPPDTSTGDRVGVAGRVMLNRSAGRLQFATVQDGTGQVQVMLRADHVGAAAFARWRHDVDLGDHVGVYGEVVTTRRGELTVAADEWRLTAKCLRPMPGKHPATPASDTPVRLSPLGLLTSEAARDMLRVRGRVVAGLRDHLIGQGFVEVETPVLQHEVGGDDARAFATHAGTRDLRLYLRTTPELLLKQLVVGGQERVFELSRSFRDEPPDAAHHPEFTTVEAYQAYSDYDTMLTLARQLIQHAASWAYGAPVARRGGPAGTATTVDLAGTWPVTTVNQALSAALGKTVDNDTTVRTLAKLCDAADISYAPQWSRGMLVRRLYEQFCQARTGAPTFYRDFPADTAPLARRHRADPRMAERWDLVAFGVVVGSGSSVLTDPVEQRRRLAARPAAGTPEAAYRDEDFLAALEYGMPPTGGLGVGVERLVMMLTGRTVAEAMLFPGILRGGAG